MTLRSRLQGLLVPVSTDPEVVAAAPPVPVPTIFRRFWPDTRPFRKWLAVGLVFIVLVPAIETLEVWLFKRVVDDVLVPAELGPLPWLAAAFLGLALLGALISFGDDYLATWIGERFLLSLRGRLYGNLLRQPAEVLDRRRLGDLLTRLTGDVQAIERLVLAALGDALSAIVRILFFTGALFYLQWDLALVSLVVAPLFFVAARRFSGLVKATAREKRRRSGSLGAVAEEALANAPLVQAYGRHDSELERFRRENAGIAEAELAAARVRGLYAPIVDLIELAGGLLVIAWGTWALSEGRLTLGGLFAFLAYLGLLYSPIRELGRLGTTVFAAAAAAERVLELLDREPTVTTRPGARPLARARGTVEFDDVVWRYPGSGEPVVNGVTLRIEPGETLALVGQSGAGKTTLARLLLRFFDPDEGAVRLDGHDVRDLTLESLRENVAVVFQETLVFHGTIRENIAYGKPEATDTAILGAAAAAGVDRFVSELPEGYDTVVGQKGRLLSGGQRQRVAIARALVRDAPVLILDEPSAGLDDDTTGHLLEPLRELAAGRTTILISHNPLLVREATHVAVLRAGRIVEYGRADAFDGARHVGAVTEVESSP